MDKRAGFLMGEISMVVQEGLDIFAQPDLAVLDQDWNETYGSAFEECDQQPIESQWLLAADAFPEIQRTANEACARFLGSVAIKGESANTPLENSPNGSTLMAATQLAGIEGPNRAASEQTVKNNVRTDLAERLFKAAHQSVVHLRMIDGKLQQESRKLTDLHRNALEYTVLIPEMLRRTRSELTNALLFEYLHQAGLLERFNALVISPSSTTMTLEEKKRYNMFIDTETCSIQMLSACGDEVRLETALVAGKQSPDSVRHDMDTIRRMAEQHGLELGTSNGTDLIQHVILVPKDEVSGVSDVVGWYDDAAGGTFYGEDKPRQDYAAYAAECQARSDSFEDTVSEITAILISEAHSFKTPMDAILRLDELSEMFSVKRAIQDKSINAAVFGETAAAHIQDARFFLDRGDMDRYESSMAMAQSTAESGSCPLITSLSGNGGPDSPNATGEGELAENKWMSCPYCGAKVYGDPCAKKLACWDCTALVVDGKIISKGNGGTAKRLARQAAEAQPTPERHKVPQRV